MKIPGFTAEASLYRATRFYHPGVRNSSASAVSPQLAGLPPIGGIWCSGGCAWNYLLCVLGCGGYSDMCYLYCKDVLSRCIDDCLPSQTEPLF